MHAAETETRNLAPIADRAAADARAELRRALARYEALASTPRHLATPLVGDRASWSRAILAADRAGNAARADELADCLQRDGRRLVLLARFRRQGRSARAWGEVADRLWRALLVAGAAGAIAGDARTAVADRIADARARAAAAALRGRDRT